MEEGGGRREGGGGGGENYRGSNLGEAIWGSNLGRQSGGGNWGRQSGEGNLRRQSEEQGGFMSLTLTRNAVLEDFCASLSHFQHWRLQNTVVCKGKFQIHANGVRVVKATCLKSAACQQK